MVEITSEERVYRALQRKESDHVPHFEWLVDWRAREALCPGCKGHNDFAVQMGYVSQDTEEEHGIEVESPIKAMTDFEPVESFGAGVSSYPQTCTHDCRFGGE